MGKNDILSDKIIKNEPIRGEGLNLWGSSQVFNQSHSIENNEIKIL